MEKQIRMAEAVAEAITFQVPALDEVAETIRDNALASARVKLWEPERSADLAALLCRADFLDYFKYGLASGVARTLAASDPNVQAVYVYDPSTNADSDSGEDMPQDATVHLLLRVTQSSAALEAYIVALDRALAASLIALPSPRFAQRESILDVNSVSDDDVRRGVNYAGLLAGVFAPPLNIWRCA